MILTGSIPGCRHPLDPDVVIKILAGAIGQLRHRQGVVGAGDKINIGIGAVPTHGDNQVGCRFIARIAHPRTHREGVRSGSKVVTVQTDYIPCYGRDGQNCRSLGRR